MGHDLNRFIEAQRRDYPSALEEIRSGRKVGHWMWYIFPQLKGLGSSRFAEYYGIEDAKEAAAYLKDPYLGGNLREICAALLCIEGSSASEVMGWPDDLKLNSCMTLFANVCEDNRIFLEVLEKYYGGRQDSTTLRMLGRKAS